MPLYQPEAGVCGVAWKTRHCEPPQISSVVGSNTGLGLRKRIAHARRSAFATRAIPRLGACYKTGAPSINCFSFTKRVSAAILPHTTVPCPHQIDISSKMVTYSSLPAFAHPTTVLFQSKADGFSSSCRSVRRPATLKVACSRPVVLRMAAGESEDKSIPQGFTFFSEKLNGRAAMIGFVLGLATELINPEHPGIVAQVESLFRGISHMI